MSTPFHISTHNQGDKVRSQGTQAKTPHTATGIFALLGGLLRVRGTGAQKISQAGPHIWTADKSRFSGPAGQMSGSCAGAQKARKVAPSPHSRRSSSTLLLASTTALILACLTLGVPLAQAEVTHEFLPVPSEKLSKGVPVGCGTSQPEPPCISGPVSGLDTMTIDSGHLWIAEHMEGTLNYRVDKFDVASGQFVSQFARAEQNSPEYLGVAVGHLTGAPEPQVYLAEIAYGVSPPTVGVYSESGAKLGSGWTGKETPAKSFELIQGVAVDNSQSLSDPAAGDVYVADQGQKVVDVFTPEVGGNEKSLTQLPGTFESPQRVVVNSVNGDVLVVDQEAAVDVFEPEPGVPGFPPTYKLLLKISSTPNAPLQQISGVAVDTDGNIYIPNQPGGVSQVDEFNAAGAYLGHITGTGTASGLFSSLRGVAVDPTSHDLYVGAISSSNQHVVDVFGPDIVIPDVTTKAALNVKPLSARLEGTVNLDHEGPATCRFVYGTTKEFGQTAPCSKPVTDETGSVEVHADIAKLEPYTTYFYRLEATDKNGTNPGESSQDQEVTTLGPGLRAESVSNVGSTSATFEATIDPHGSPTAYRFEYDTSAYGEGEAPHGTSTPIPDEGIGSQAGEVQVLPRRIQGLAPATLYHYRLVVVSEPKVGEPETFYSPDHTFTTQESGSGLVLPDARQWELVSPADAHGASFGAIAEIGLIQASTAGDALTYHGSPTESGVEGNGIEETQILSVRGTHGWSSRDIATSRSTPEPAPLAHGTEYRFFSNDLSHALTEPWGPFTSLAPHVTPPDTEHTIYIRNDATCETDPATCFEPLVTGAPGYADVPEGTKFGGNPLAPQGEVTFMGATPDLSHVILSGPGGLDEWSAGKPPAEELQRVGFLPASEGGGAAVSAALASQSSSMGRGAISNDGSRVIWSGSAGRAGEAGRINLYLRDMARHETVRLDAVQPGASGSGNVQPSFQYASGDGSLVFFTDEQRLTSDAGASEGKPDLYECAISAGPGELKCDLTDLTPETPAGQADVLGVSGASEDGSYVYFVANGVLAPNAVQGTCAGESYPLPTHRCNLYLRHGGITTLVAVISEEESPDYGGGSRFLSRLTARVSPNGRYLAFMSSRSLTGYDNRDARSGVRDEEVFLYDALANRVVCASCNPTGARPLGVEVNKLNGGLVAGNSVWWRSGEEGGEERDWLAANIPGYTPAGNGADGHQSRYLSNEGRLFFNSSDALVPQDVNNNEDVYQYEFPAGATTSGSDSCTTASSTFSERSGGCVSLISSGTAPGESAFLDASENGDDVFFLSGEKLVAQAPATSVSVYDAHACTAASPCVSTPVAAPACTTADACRSAPSPQPSIFGSPSSATFSGVGNVLAPAAKPKAKPKSKPKKCRKGFVKKKGKCVKAKKSAKKAGHKGRGK
jgi:WD40-like Beta Propeller Repeat